MKIQNNKTKTTTTILGALVIGLVLLSPTMMIPNVNAVPSQHMPPPEVTQWLDGHPHFFGCVHFDLANHTSKEISCSHPGNPVYGSMKNGSPAHKIADYSYTASNLDCSSSCFTGGEFYNNGPYTQVTANSKVDTAPQTVPTKFGWWGGLTNCLQSCTASPPLLVQSGWNYQSSSGTTPNMFTEIVGNFYYGTTNCSTQFCGTLNAVHANDNLYITDYADNTHSQWVAYVQDNTYPSSNMFTIPFSTAGVSTDLPYVLTSLEAGGASTSGGNFPPSPISYTNEAIYKYGVGQVNTDTSSTGMKSYSGPTGGGITVTFTATGTSTATITDSY
ncbi:MAG TPA: hypothetical protein VFX64_01920 [Candidatus Nitrosotalea sp.]|nr:hypothetical protein [Candidatus Nitrosotalea sp.]